MPRNFVTPKLEDREHALGPIVVEFFLADGLELRMRMNQSRPRVERQMLRAVESVEPQQYHAARRQVI